MATILVSIICIGLLIVGGITMAQGILTSVDTAALSVEGISFREGELNRTQLETVRAAHLSWADLLRVTVRNDGQTKLADFVNWVPFGPRNWGQFFSNSVLLSCAKSVLEVYRRKHEIMTTERMIVTPLKSM